jgi:hypothetical protein
VRFANVRSHSGGCQRVTDASGSSIWGFPVLCNECWCSGRARFSTRDSCPGTIHIWPFFVSAGCTARLRPGSVWPHNGTNLVRAPSRDRRSAQFTKIGQQVRGRTQQSQERLIEAIHFIPKSRLSLWLGNSIIQHILELISPKNCIGSSRSRSGRPVEGTHAAISPP